MVFYDFFIEKKKTFNLFKLKLFSVWKTFILDERLESHKTFGQTNTRRSLLFYWIFKKSFTCQSLLIKPGGQCRYVEKMRALSQLIGATTAAADGAATTPKSSSLVFINTVTRVTVRVGFAGGVGVIDKRVGKADFAHLPCDRLFVHSDCRQVTKTSHWRVSYYYCCYYIFPFFFF